jgi:hypothetical protein
VWAERRGGNKRWRRKWGASGGRADKCELGRRIWRDLAGKRWCSIARHLGRQGFLVDVREGLPTLCILLENFIMVDMTHVLACCHKLSIIIRGGCMAVQRTPALGCPQGGENCPGSRKH